MAAEDPDEELYTVVYRAVNDALWNVVGTVTLALVLVAVFFVGLSVFLSSVTAAGSSLSVLGIVFGTGVAGLAAFGFALLFDLLP